MPFVNQEFIATLHSRCLALYTLCDFDLVVVGYICSHLYFILRGKAVDKCFCFSFSSHVYQVKIKSSHQTNNFPAVSVYIVTQTNIYIYMLFCQHKPTQNTFQIFLMGMNKQNSVLLQWP